MTTTRFPKFSPIVFALLLILPHFKTASADDPTRGQQLYQIHCAACHGPTGRGNPAAGYPSLRAQHSVYVVKQLSAYGADVRYTKNEHGASYGGDNAVIMHTIASRLSDEDMRNVASYIQGMR